MRVMLATPTLARTPAVEYQMAVLRTSMLLSQYGHSLDCSFVGGDCFVSKARNGLIQTFIETWTTDHPDDVLVFMDDDQGWEEAAFLRIIQDPHEFIAVCIPKKTDPETFNNVILDYNDKGECYVDNGLLRASQIGSGFIALKRSAIEKMIKAFPDQYSPGDGGPHGLHYNLFENMVIKPEVGKGIGQFWGEDLIFCKKWCSIGEHIWIDPNVTMTHIGRKTWVGNFMTYLQKNATVKLSDPEPAPIPETLESILRIAA
ncbi:MAG: hypothetical protein Q7N50_02830 [Armatimonadota bacterium]|nr:hypothetical protein [Armatimonadota bacterium]